MSDKNPKISVLMPAYNMQEYVGGAIESILNQTFSEFEFIILDDHSSDNTWEIIRRYAEKDGRIMAIRNIKNLGISGSRNKLLTLASGKYVAWQDSDDISMSLRLERQYEFMENNPDVGISGGYLHLFDENGELGIRKYAADDKSLRKTIFRFSPVSQPAAIIRKECLDETGLFPMASPVAEDLAMSFQIGMKYKFANIPEVLIKYRENKNGATFSKLRTMELYTIFLRFRYDQEKAYSMCFKDKWFSFLHFISIFILPPKIKIELFKLFRDDNVTGLDIRKEKESIIEQITAEQAFKITNI